MHGYFNRDYVTSESIDNFRRTISHHVEKETEKKKYFLLIKNCEKWYIIKVYDSKMVKSLLSFAGMKKKKKMETK